MQVLDYTTDPTLVAVLNMTAPGDVDTDTGMGTYYLGDSIVRAQPVGYPLVDGQVSAVADEWFIESVGGY